ncbi:MAG: hypothetical protein HUU35_04035 [Armatimonadetes bacterium]|nr:hypothetical protein [Armatimonadota bacterium]
MRALLLALLLIDLGAAQTLRHEWDFGRGASPWLAAHGTTATASEQGLRVEVNGDDPYLHCAAGACLDLAASPGQFIRLKLRSSHAGTAEFFWAASSAGRDAGFVAGQEIAFPVAAGEWQEIDVYPGWQGRVTRLRFDPPGDPGAVIEVARIAVYEWPASSQAGPNWDLTRDHGGWLPRGGARMSLDPEGLTIRGELPQLGRQLPAQPAAWLTLDGMAARSARSDCHAHALPPVCSVLREPSTKRAAAHPCRWGAEPGVRRLAFPIGRASAPRRRPPALGRLGPRPRRATRRHRRQRRE